MRLTTARSIWGKVADTTTSKWRMVIAPMALAPFMAATGYRFDKSWRHAQRGPKAWVYRCCWTVGANFYADDLAGLPESLGK